MVQAYGIDIRNGIDSTTKTFLEGVNADTKPYEEELIPKLFSVSSL